MIHKDFITEWRAHAPWQEDFQVEQDLVASRALVELFARDEISGSLAFRGGTAIHKLHLSPAVRYSEDIDLVQEVERPIGGTLDAIHEALDPWLGKARTEIKERGTTLVYRFASEDPTPVRLRLKVEINTREHRVLGVVRRAFSVPSRWFRGSADVVTYDLPDLIGTKLRALFQRKKGRDLFDVACAMKCEGFLVARAIAAFTTCMRSEGRVVTRAAFEENLAEKVADPSFADDVRVLLRLGSDWDPSRAGEEVATRLLALLPGPPWDRRQPS